MHSMFYRFLLEVLIISLTRKAVEILASRFLDEPISFIDIGSESSAPVLERIEVLYYKTILHKKSAAFCCARSLKLEIVTFFLFR